MIFLQTYFMLKLKVPNLVWNAMVYNWPWFQEMQNETLKAGFKEELSLPALDNRMKVQSITYRLEILKRVFSQIDGGFSIRDLLEFFDGGEWTDYCESHWINQDGHYFYKGIEVSAEEWYEKYRTKTAEHVDNFM